MKIKRAVDHRKVGSWRYRWSAEVISEWETCGEAAEEQNNVSRHVGSCRNKRERLGLRIDLKAARWSLEFRDQNMGTPLDRPK